MSSDQHSSQVCVGSTMLKPVIRFVYCHLGYQVPVIPQIAAGMAKEFTAKLHLHRLQHYHTWVLSVPSLTLPTAG